MYNMLASSNFILKNNDALVYLKKKHGYKKFTYHPMNFEFADRFRRSASSILKPKKGLELEKFLCEELPLYGGVLQALEDQHVPDLGVCFEALHGLSILQIYADGELKIRRDLSSSNSSEKNLAYELSSILRAVDLPAFKPSDYGRHQLPEWFPKRKELLDGIKDIISKRTGPMVKVCRRNAK